MTDHTTNGMEISIRMAFSTGLHDLGTIEKISTERAGFKKH
jgi:hypothetical protein